MIEMDYMDALRRLSKIKMYLANRFQESAGFSEPNARETLLELYKFTCILHTVCFDMYHYKMFLDKCLFCAIKDDFDTLTETPEFKELEDNANLGLAPVFNEDIKKDVVYLKMLFVNLTA